MAANTEAKIKVEPSITEHKWRSLNEEERWGTVTDTQQHPFRIANGIMRIRERDDDTYNWVNAINTSNEPIEIRKGDTVGYLKKLHSVFEILHISENATAADRAPGDATSDNTRVGDTDAMTEAEIDSLIASKPHLKDLNLLKEHQHLTKEQHLMLKKLIVKYDRLWDTTPKPTPDHLPPCDIKLREDTFEHQGRVLPMNPTTRTYLRSVIEDTLKRNIIEPSMSPC